MASAAVETRGGASPPLVSAGVYKGLGPEAFIYAPEKARKATAQAIEDARQESIRWQAAARKADQAAEASERRAHDVHLDAAERTKEIELDSVKKSAAYEEKLRDLQAKIEEEREVHAVQCRHQLGLIEQAGAQAEERVKEVERRCDEAVAAAEARIREADANSAETQRRCDEELAIVRARDAAVIQDTRRLACEELQKGEERKRLEIEETQRRVALRQRAMEETLYANGRQKSEAVQEARRHVLALEMDVKELRLAQEADMATKESRFHEWRAQERGQLATMRGHHDGLLELEKGLHRRTMERTMARVARHLHGDAFSGDATPTREVLRDLTVGASAAQAAAASPPLSPLALAGGAVL